MDGEGVQSIGNSFTLPALQVRLSARDDQGQAVSNVIKRQVMNRLWFTVDNRGRRELVKVSLVVKLTDSKGISHRHVSLPFSVGSNSQIQVPVVVGGYADLDASVNLQIELTQAQASSRWTIQQQAEIDVSNAALINTVITKDFVRGASGKVSFSIENTSNVVSEILMARHSGQQVSGQIRFILEDEDGNLLSMTEVKQSTGEVVTLSNKQTIARLQPNTTWTSGEFTLKVPQAAPDTVRIRLEIDQLHYQLGKDQQVSIKGLGGSRLSNLIEAPYKGELSSITPASVFVEDNTKVTIKGRAVDTQTGSCTA